MKKQLIAAAALTALMGASANAQNAQMNVNLSGSVPAQCAATFFNRIDVRDSTPDTPADNLGNRAGGGTWAINGSESIDLQTLQSGGFYDLGSISFRCNTSNGFVAWDTSNGFALQNGSNAIGYNLELTNDGPGSVNTPGQVLVGGVSGANGDTMGVRITLDTFSAFNLAPGTYEDTLEFTISPSI